MKAAMNGVPSLSVLDGWWIEGHVEWFTGWAIGGTEPTSDLESDAEALYRKLESAVLPMFYDRAKDFSSMRRSTIALNGSFFTSQRMVDQYVKNAYATADLR
jgi:starch phosphorylase